MTGPLYLVLAVMFNSAANVLFKTGSVIEEFTLKKGLLLGLGLGLGFLNTVSFIRSLETLDLGVAYPVFCAASIVLIAVLSYGVLHETMSVQKVIGLSILCAGIVVLWKA